MKNFTNYIAIDKHDKVRQIFNTHDIDFLADYNKAIRLGWKIIKGEQNEGYVGLMKRLNLR